MLRITRLIGSAASVILLMMLAAFTSSVPVHAASGLDSVGPQTQTAGVASSDPVVACQTWRIVVRGAQPAVGTCYNGRTKSGHTIAWLTAGHITPYVTNHNPCQSGDLHLWQDNNNTGADICFGGGSGNVNLSDWRVNVFVTWDNTASSWVTNGRSGSFYAGAGTSGTSQSFSYRTTGNFDCNYICNDDLSSFHFN